MHETRTIFFIGKPGCGKGTQAKLLSQVTGWPTFSSGKLFREIAKEDTPVGRKVKSEIDAGYLSPHWFAMYLYEKSLFSLPSEASAIFDGFNRKVAEAELIVESLKWLARSFLVIHLTVSDAEVHRRLEIRKGVEGRVDDNAVETRMEEYRLHTIPALEIFRTAGTLIEINGERPEQEIAAEISAALGLTPTAA